MDAIKAERYGLCSDGDLLLRCKDGKELRAHKAMLRLASPVLRGLIDSTLSAHQDGETVIPVEEDDVDTWEHILCWLYPLSAKPEISWDTVEAMLMVSHKYNIVGVEAQCKVFLYHKPMSCSAISAPRWPELSSAVPMMHVLRWLPIAERLDDQELMIKCLKLIRDAHSLDMQRVVCTAAFVASFKPDTIAALLRMVFI